MFDEFIKILRRLFDRSYRYDDDSVETFTDEYTLLIQNKRIIDYSKMSKQLNLPMQVGIYRDTYKFLSKGLKKDQAIANIGNVLSCVPVVYNVLEKEKSNLIANETESFKRVFKIFAVKNIITQEGTTENKFCLNLFIRPHNKSFIVIGKMPKGKLKKLEQQEGIIKTTTSTDTSWETIDFE